MNIPYADDLALGFQLRADAIRLLEEFKERPVLSNHACRYELFDQNPIRLVRQSAKRRLPPTVLTAEEIKKLLEVLAVRERTLVLLAGCTGLRQSELFGLKWSDIDFAGGTMNVMRS